MNDQIMLFEGVWLPSHETHMREWMKKRNTRVDGKLTYQYNKLQAAMPFVKNWRTAVDVGAHVGFWSMHLAKKFKELHAFEPVPLHRECFTRNVHSTFYADGRANEVYLHDCALGAGGGKVSMHTTPGSSGDTWVDPTVAVGDTEMLTLDSFALEDVDFLKIDCEGYELFVLEGAEETVRHCKPCIVVEQKEKPESDPRKFSTKYGIKPRAALELLQSWGFQVQKEWSGDFILTA